MYFLVSSYKLVGEQRNFNLLKNQKKLYIVCVDSGKNNGDDGNSDSMLILVEYIHMDG